MGHYSQHVQQHLGTIEMCNIDGEDKPHIASPIYRDELGHELYQIFGKNNYVIQKFKTSHVQCRSI